jgi:peptidoglycan/LPS O-acetylase OafA/YrhL
MIQRVQSIWLFLASLTLFLLLILPIVATHAGNTELWLQVAGVYSRTADGVLKTTSYPGLLGLTVAGCVLCLIAIFLFKNRSLQKNMIIVAIVLILVIILCIASYAYQLTSGFQHVSLNIGAALPLLALIFCALAFRGIRHDEQLIRSADRLR